jgi:hypothetical protein
MSNKIKVTKEEFGMTFNAEVQMSNGVYVWATNGRVPPKDSISSYGIDKLPGFDKALHDKVREDQTRKALEAYRESMESYELSGEQLFEMRAAFGRGAAVVDIVTGKKVRL